MHLNQSLKNLLKPAFLCSVVYCFAGCHSYMLDDAQNDLRNSFNDNNYEESKQLLDKFEKDNIYRSKDQVLFHLESGTIYHFAGDYDQSSLHFSKAETEIDQNFTKSISRGAGAFLTNDNKLVYDGEPYEDVYLNAFKALNYIHQQDWQSALVETRRMSYKMEQLDVKIKGLAEALSKSDSTGKAEWNTGKVNIQNSAFSHYLSTVLYSKSGKYDDARIEYEKLQAALNEQSEVSGFRTTSSKEIQKLAEPDSYNILLTGFSGRAPYKVQEDARIFIDDYSTEDNNEFYLKFSFPALETYNSRVSGIRAIINDSIQTDLNLIEEMDLVSADVYKAKQPVIYSRALVRASVKAASTKIISGLVGEKNSFLGDILQILGFIGQEVTEKADLRGWQTMPGKAWANVIKLPPGSHTVRIEYLSFRNRVLLTEEFEVIVTPETELELIESIYAN